ncbi:MAG: Diaminohydroxyphosphoribosylaminopyrimidine deaminase (EC / 5-amino-6-(5-phosphoribosylamino)uracil reductase (EC [uncultured Thiotrichaceae bacterium]|uniref:Riboflavin biosynthesis protein RibD n=1 Tax=uncultured Thiotrichaceae bacterium TaxID=298394 RepID=A0A6S6T959_9GAMM|nr:MAG: Diaminohydroxyphosphoribosylaminopyrimidine deaminase (EC / 5-amino-6-(5-phosphoribosylamino)uracil reductase (EC [uncultured Thiotrichaceae bacterium]
MTEFSHTDHQHMARAIQLARRGRYTTHPNPNVGCVMVRDGKVLAEGWTQPVGGAHAEIHALQQVNYQAEGAEVYVTLEPCAHFGRTPPCSDALIKAKVKRVVAAMVDPNPQVSGRGLLKLQQAGVQTAQGLLENEARQLIPGFISAMTRQRPFVRIKMAMSLDGRTAMASGESVWITGAAARQDVQFWRARAGAVLTGIGTVLMDKPSLNVRLTPEQLGIHDSVRQPDRVILDAKLQFPEDAPLLQHEGIVRIYTCSEDSAKIARLQQQGVIIRQFSGDRPELNAVLSALYDDGITEVHVEAGATLTGSLVEAGLADELLIYMAPCLMGSTARPLFQLPFEHMQERLALDIRDMRAIGSDWRILAGIQAVQA